MDLNKSTINPTRVYLDAANALYDKNEIERNLSLYITDVIGSIDKTYPAYALALENSGKKECIVVYSIIQKLLEGEQ